jgi:predicted NAD-dependent protein-ADP-ribosyltransferase YbiA (DUF1768 family)
MGRIYFYESGKDYDFLSNVTDIPVSMCIGTAQTAPTMYNHIPCAEQAYHALKKIDDPVAQKQLLRQGNFLGQTAQATGRTVGRTDPSFDKSAFFKEKSFFAPVRGFKKLRGEWKAGWVKEDVMYDVCMMKATQHPQIAAFLIKAANNGDVFIENAGKEDAFWGNGGDGKGRNALGKIWTQISKDLRKEYNHTGQIGVRISLRDKVAAKLGYAGYNNGLSKNSWQRSDIDPLLHEDVKFEREIGNSVEIQSTGHVKTDPQWKENRDRANTQQMQQPANSTVIYPTYYNNATPYPYMPSSAYVNAGGVGTAFGTPVASSYIQNNFYYGGAEAGNGGFRSYDTSQSHNNYSGYSNATYASTAVGSVGAVIGMPFNNLTQGSGYGGFQSHDQNQNGNNNFPSLLTQAFVPQDQELNWVRGKIASAVPHCDMQNVAAIGFSPGADDGGQDMLSVRFSAGGSQALNAFLSHFAGETFAGAFNVQWSQEQDRSYQCTVTPAVPGADILMHGLGMGNYEAQMIKDRLRQQQQSSFFSR